MSNKQQLMQAAAKEMTVDQATIERIRAIQTRVMGWSGPAHYAFFRELLELPIKSMLMLGVYHGRDLTFIADILREYHPAREIMVWGVDRFTEDPCADWASTNKPRTWQDEAHVPPPDEAEARRNVAHDARIAIIRADDFTYMDATAQRFDAIYLDTAHDYNTLARQFRQAQKIANPDAVMCGDDFSDQYTWGVRSAVEHTFSEYLLFGGWIWAAFNEDRKVKR